MDETNSVQKLLDDLSRKKGISEISINGPKEVFVERDGKLIQLAIELKSGDIDSFIEDLRMQRQEQFGFAESSPIINTSLADGSRVNAICSPFAKGSSAISIRKYIKNIKDFSQNEGIFGLYGKWIDFMRAIVRSRMNVVICGGTGTGKTTLLNLMLSELSQQERIITIEDTLELSFDHRNLVRLESFQSDEFNISTRDLVKNTLRMRPDRIIIGESRGGEFFDLLQAMNTGHDGSMSTIHANSAQECLQRMETLFLLCGFEVPIPIVRRQISTGIDFIFHISKDRDGKRYVENISEITGMEGDQILSANIARHSEGELRTTGITPEVVERLTQEGGLPRDFFA